MRKSSKRVLQYKDESDLKDKAIAAIKKEYGRNVWIYKSNDLSTLGIPDLIISFWGAFVGIELKMINSEEPDGSPIQKRNLHWIRKSGGFGFVAHSVEEVMGGIDGIRRIITNWK